MNRKYAPKSVAPLKPKTHTRTHTHQTEHIHDGDCPAKHSKTTVSFDESVMRFDAVMIAVARTKSASKGTVRHGELSACGSVALEVALWKQVGWSIRSRRHERNGKHGTTDR